MKEKIYQSMIELTNGSGHRPLLRNFQSHSKKSIPLYIKYFNIQLIKCQGPKILPRFMTFLFDN